MYCRLLLPSTLYMKKNLHLTLPGPYSSKKLICTSPFKMKSSDGWWSWPEKTTITKYKACFCRNKQENDIFNSNGLGPLTYESWSWEYNTVAWKQLRESDYQIIKPLGWFSKCFLQTTSKFIVIIKNLNFNCLFDLSQKLYLLSISFAKHHLSIGSMFVVPWLFQVTSNQTSFEIHRWQGIHNNKYYI